MKPKQRITTAGGGICLAAALSLTLVAAGTIFAQGPLTPPGAPAPTMKTLGQVEPRTPISSLPFTISLPGSYYLKTSLTGNPDASQPMTNGQYPVTGGFWLPPCAVQTPGAPLLTIVSSAPGQTTLSWSPDTPGFILQETLSLSPAEWTNSPSGSTNPITVPATLPAKFYRLFK